MQKLEKEHEEKQAERPRHGWPRWGEGDGAPGRSLSWCLNNWKNNVVYDTYKPTNINYIIDGIINQQWPI